MRILLLVPVWFVLALLIPTVWTIVRSYRAVRGSWPVICPETGLGTTVELNAGNAVGMRILGNPPGKIQSCSRWPERQGCGRECLRQFEPAA